MFVDSVGQVGASSYVMLQIVKQQRSDQPIEPIDKVKSATEAPVEEMGWLEALTSSATIETMLINPLSEVSLEDDSTRLADELASKLSRRGRGGGLRGMGKSKAGRKLGKLLEDEEEDEDSIEQAIFDDESESIEGDDPLLSLFDAISSHVDDLTSSPELTAEQLASLTAQQNEFSANIAEAVEEYTSGQSEADDFLDHLKDAFKSMADSAGTTFATQEHAEVYEPIASTLDSSPLPLDTLREAFADEVNKLTEAIATEAFEPRGTQGAGRIDFEKLLAVYNESKPAQTQPDTNVLAGLNAVA